MKRIRNYVVIIACLLSSSMANAQVAKAFDKKDVHFISIKEDVEVKLDDGVPISVSTVEKVMKFNTEKAITQLRSHSIYYSSFEQINELSATVESPENGKTKTYKVKNFSETNSKSSGIFYDDSKQVSFDLPGLAVGSIVTISYKVLNTECHYFHSFYFNSYLPAESLSYSMTVPTKIKMKFFEKFIDPTIITFTKDEKKKETVYQWTTKNRKDYDAYGNSPAISYSYPHVVPQIESIEEDGKQEPYMGSVTALYKWYRGNMKNVNRELDPKVAELAKEITAKATTRDEKIKAIFDYTKENIKYVAFEDGMNGLIPRNSNLVLSKKYGDCKDLSCFMNQMLKAIDIPSYPTWIGTRAIPYTYEELPAKNSDNHMILSVQNGKEWLYLDATDPNGIYGFPTDHIQGKQALIGISDDKYELAMVPIISSKQNTVQDTFAMKLNGKDVIVDASVRFNGLLANNISRNFRYMDKKEKEDFIKAYFKDGNDNLVLNTFDINIVNEGLLILKSNYTLKDYARVIGDETYLNYHLNRMYTSSAIDDKERSVPVEFDRNVTHTTLYRVEIPEGKKLDYIPEDKNFNDAAFNFQFKNTTSGKYLEALQSLELNFPDLYLQPKQFPKWNEMLGKMNKQYNETVIIK